MFCDSDWASQADRKSVSGYVFVLAGGAVAWSSKKQTTVVLSTAEAEYTAAVHATKQLLWHCSLLTEVGLPTPKVWTLRTDNQAAIAIAHHPEFHPRTKHIDIAMHFLRDHVEKGTLNIIYVPTEDNVADLFTKRIPREQHQKLTASLGVMPGQGGVLESGR